MKDCELRNSQFSAASAPRPLPALSLKDYDELRVLLVQAVRETEPFGATPGLLRTVAREFIAARLAGQIAQLVDNEIDLQVKSGLFITVNSKVIGLATSPRNGNEKQQ